jgi:ATP-dependent RNA helicase DHX29
MAGAKKKKSKPSTNPARGFTTTSVASRPRVDANASPCALESSPGSSTKPDSAAGSKASNTAGASATAHSNTGDIQTQPEASLSPAEFEKQLEESELQLLVEKYARKVKRDASRQKTRLDTERRLLRAQAEALNTRKWLPQELMDQILDLIQAESRFATSSASSLNSERPANEKMPSEEELAMKLWTLQQTLTDLFSPEKVKAVLEYVLELTPSVASANKDYVWGLEEALDWLAKSCSREELRDYEYKGTKPSKSQPGTSVFVVPSLAPRGPCTILL